MRKQVDKAHYEFNRYISKRRWASIWHQLDEVLALKPKHILEIGPGPGVFKALADLFGTPVETLDIDTDLEPDYVASADQLPFVDNAYDMVCAFQVLEHVPYETTLTIFSEMARIARQHIVISLPDARPAWPYSIHVPLKGELKFLIPKPWKGPWEHQCDGEHYWEVNKKGFSLKMIKHNLEHAASVQLKKTYRVPENPYHRFFLFNAK